ncbi:YmfQ family protein [Pectobacterium sp. CHL-2024]|uniref:YmfQ family protein n=1 Tax=Pectobacterium sp. CHL-2024 TaxID=3377079 RepID=UPI0037F5EB46
MSQYDVDDYTHALQNLMPTGMAWPRSVNGIQYALLRALAQSFHATDVTAHELLTGAFPATATMMLPEWEATLGLPDDCAIGDIVTIEQRRQAVVTKLLSTGGQSKTYFIELAAMLGYEVTITEYRQARAGLSVCGDPLNGEFWPFVWLVTITKDNPNGSIRLLRCRLDAFSPSHTVFQITIESNLKLTLTLSNGVLSGELTANAGIVVSGVDITLFYSLAGGKTETVVVKTDSDGKFSVTPGFNIGYDVLAHATVLNQLGEWENVESSLSTRFKFNGVIKFNGSNKFRG